MWWDWTHIPFFGWILIFLGVTTVVAPIADGIGKRIARGGKVENPPDYARLTTELERAEQRLADAEHRLQQAEERLDFQEKLLTARSSAPREPHAR